MSVAVKVQPKSRRPGVQVRGPAIDGERLRIGVTEAAEDGRANREKTVRVEGDPAAIVPGLAAL